MKGLVSILIFGLLANSALAAADSLVRSSVHKYTRYTTDGVKDYDLDKIKDSNKKSEDDAITQARKELKCRQFEKLDIAQVKISPEAMLVGQDQQVSIQIYGICLSLQGV